MSDIDKHLTAAALELLERLEAALAPDCGAIVLLYNKRGRDLDLSIAVMNGDPGEELKILRAAETQLRTQMSQGVPVERFVAPVEPVQEVITSLEVTRVPRHDLVRVWNRGGLAGELVLERGDGALLAARLWLDSKEPSEGH